MLRPQPGGSVNSDFADFMTRSTYWVPSSLIILLLAVVLFIWLPYRRSILGRAAYAIGSSEQAAYMSGVPIARAKILAYALSGLLAAIAGLLLTVLTYSGEARRARRRLHAQFDRRGGHRRHVAVRRRRAAPSARSSAPSSCAPSAICCSSST